MRSITAILSLSLLATSTALSAQDSRSAPPPLRAGAMRLGEGDVARNPIPAKRDQLIDIYLPTEQGTEWKVTYQNMVRIDALIAPSSPSDGPVSTPASGAPVGASPQSATGDRGLSQGRVRPPQTVVRLRLSDMGGYWGLTMVQIRRATSTEPERIVRSLPFKFVVS